MISSLPKIVNFDQGASAAGRSGEQTIPPYNYYNPQVFLAKEAFDLFPGEECLAIINGVGYRYNDDTIYHLTCSTASDSSGGSGSGGEDTVDGVSSSSSSGSITTCSNVHLKLESESQLCIFVKNCSNENAFKIGYNTPLNWLLDMPRMMSKLCYCSMADLIKIKQLLGRQPKINSEMLTTMDETIVIR